MLGKSCPWSTRIQLTQQSQPLSLDDTGGVFAFAFGTRWCAVSGSSTFPLLDRPALQIGRRVQWSCRSSKKKTSIRYGTGTQQASLIRSYGGIAMSSGEPCAK